EAEFDSLGLSVAEQQDSQTDSGSEDKVPTRKASNLIFKLAMWMLTILCFYLVYSRTEAKAAFEGLTVAEYLIRFFADANWLGWLMLMVP
ncbi:MAG TPA: hypothetical protein DDZ38_03855, partial [Gammaproteobacteria bacterium]|nr:hypothetical protein [Gammaproteobacteria bacterium]